MKRQSKGITLVALIVTIIILLILAGIAIAQLTGSGLLEKSKQASDKSQNAQDEENLILGDYETQINKIINGNRNDENSQLKNCTITISETGTITVQNVDKMIVFAIIQDGKCIDATKNETYSLSVPVNQTVEVYIIAVDENSNLYKSNVVSYTGKALYLYNEGDKCEAITGGWTVTKDSNARFDIDSFNYIDLESYLKSYCGIALTTNVGVDVTNYNKLKMNYTATNNNSSSQYTIGLHNGKFTGIGNIQTGINYHGTVLSDVGENLTFEFDISDKKGNFYIAYQQGQIYLKIHKIWLE